MKWEHDRVKIDMSIKCFAGFFRRFRPLLILSLFWLALGGCEASDRAQSAPPPHYEPRVLSLGLTGYNYTDRSISEFFVDGRGGGNVGVSTPTSGGGGTVCCVSYVVAKDPGSVNIRWQSDACYYHVKSTISDEVYNRIHWFFKEAEVEIERPAPQNPKYFEVHFYPDGSVKAAVSEHAGEPRLKLQENRDNRTSYPRCPDDKKPAD